MMQQIASRNEIMSTENSNLKFKMDQLLNQNQTLASQIQAIQAKEKVRDENEKRIFDYISTIDN